MKVNKIIIKIRNDNWYQVGKHLIIKQMSNFKAHQISIIEDEDTVKAMKQIIEDDMTNESFIALETSVKLENSVLSK